jgi:hypothetical protein
MTLPQNILTKSSLPYFEGVKLDDFLDGMDFYQVQDEFYPVFGIPGTLIEGEKPDFKPGNGDELLICTPVSFSYSSLDYFKIKDSIWELYYEDRYRGYLFQVIPIIDDITQLKFLCY